MTNGEHNLWLGDALKAVPEIERQLRIANAISIAKELHSIPASEGGMNTENYVGTLTKLLNGAGFTIT